MLDLLAIPLIGVVAAIPMFLYAWAFYLADRYEREPGWLVLVVFLWGALPSVALSLVAELILGQPFFGPPDSLAQTLYESSLVAPLVEEAAKGLAVYAIYRLYRQEFDGVLDGLTYGALVGFGFAMTENFLYFLGAYFEGGLGALSVLFVLRSVIFGLNHAVYTGLFGVGLGMAHLSRSQAAARLWIGGGFAAAAVIHGLHNLGSSLSPVTELGLVLSLGLAGIGVAFVVLVHLLAGIQERQWIRQELAEEIGVLLTEEEYRALQEGWRRSPLLRQARGREARRLRALVELAFRKHRLRRLSPKSPPKLEEEIARLRSTIRSTQDRER